MKKLFACVFLGLTCASAFAATGVSEASVQKAAPTKKIQSEAPPLVGVWVSTERTAVVAPGKMTLTDKGAVTLAPEGFDPLKGTYKVQGRFIDIKTDRGNAALIYKLDKDKLTVQYENGAFQNFIKQQPAAPLANNAQKKANK